MDAPRSSIDRKKPLNAAVREPSPGRGLLAFAAVIIIIAGLKVAAEMIVPILFAFLLASMVLPGLRWLQSKKVPFALAILVIVFVIAVGLLSVGGVLAKSVSDFTGQMPEYTAKLTATYKHALAYLDRVGVDVTELDLAASIDQAMDPSAAMGFISKMLNSISGVLSNFMLIVITLVFVLMEAAGFPRKILAAWPNSADGSSRLAEFDAGAKAVQRYLVIKTITSLATGFTIGLWVFVLGLDFPLLWGMLAFLFNYIPNIGSIIAAIPALILALIQLGPGMAIVVALGYLGVNVAVGNFIEPKVMGKNLGLSTLVVFLSLIFWGWLWGPVGMLLSVPLTVIVKIMLEHRVRTRPIAILMGPSPPKEPKPQKKQK
jgi:AI-2 transport protein TqsA